MPATTAAEHMRRTKGERVDYDYARSGARIRNQLSQVTAGYTQWYFDNKDQLDAQIALYAASMGRLQSSAASPAVAGMHPIGSVSADLLLWWIFVSHTRSGMGHA